MTAQSDDARQAPIPAPRKQPDPDFMERIQRAKDVREAAKRAHESHSDKSDASHRLGFLVR